MASGRHEAPAGGPNPRASGNPARAQDDGEAGRGAGARKDDNRQPGSPGEANGAPGARGASGATGHEGDEAAARTRGSDGGDEGGGAATQAGGEGNGGAAASPPGDQAARAAGGGGGGGSAGDEGYGGNGAGAGAARAEGSEDPKERDGKATTEGQGGSQGEEPDHLHLLLHPGLERRRLRGHGSEVAMDLRGQPFEELVGELLVAA